MKIVIDQDDNYEDIELTIHCKEINEQVQKLLSLLKTDISYLIGKKKDSTYQISLDTIYYIESIDNKTYIYTDKDVYENNFKLYEIDKKLKHTNFIQISKSCIMNIDKLVSVKALLNGKYEAKLLNKEVLIISRRYVADFKKIFGI